MSHLNIHPDLLPFLDALAELLVADFPPEPEGSDAGAPPQVVESYHDAQTANPEEEGR